jgi:hypothetical protein
MCVRTDGRQLLPNPVTEELAAISPEANPNIGDQSFTRPRKRSSIHAELLVYSASIRCERGFAPPNSGN